MGAKSRGNFAFKPNPEMCCPACVFKTGEHAEWCGKAGSRLVHLFQPAHRENMEPGDHLDVLIPGKFSAIRAAMASAAIEGDQFASDALETIRRVEAGEPVGERYVKRLNEFMRRCEEPYGLSVKVAPPDAQQERLERVCRERAEKVQKEQDELCRKVLNEPFGGGETRE